ncbi:MAG TPA: SET domain-containing protein-lysine N-methyltransferase [Chloroflexota bacterium]|nr:SET domain-containing protein-lysine N-methyltransferase [Chloroflexota bacterium]
MPTKEDTRGAGKRAAKKPATKGTKRVKGAKAAKRTAPAATAVKGVQGSKDGREWFEIRNSRIHGKGAFAIRDIPKGTRFAEYVGQKIEPEVAWERYDDDNMEQHHTFLFTLDDDTLIDAGVRGNNTRFINHSCDPNCKSSTEDGHIYFDAIKDIPKGTELTYDYRLTREGRYQKHWDELYRCRCGSANCRGTILLRRKRKAKA